ncbi:BON domain-containing protein [Chitinimonas arctica]|uniref:Osmotically-inducible protein Y n=1 Tax=Chitinimonas arctica TaxID=2594795 RepID=A0A516SCF2_9NEIS|nr:BON domain-containing protein [Chitinimonas arctica]QDQ25827.1 BON domain-containing protein [Chitinimonas arctica]
MQNRHLIPGLLAALFIAAPAMAAEAGATGAGPAASAGQALDDTAITAKVKAALMADKQVSALDVKVKTEQGVVTLTGTVDKAEANDRAQQLAAAVSGVKSVNSQLQLKTAVN